MKWFPLLVFLFVFLFPIVSAGAQQKTEATEIISISYTRDSAGAELILIHLAGPVNPELFMLRGEKPRLVVDFFNSYYKGQNPIPLPDGMCAVSIRSGIHQKPVPKTRVVIDLRKDIPVRYTHFFDEVTDILTVKLENVAVASGGNESATDWPVAGKTRQQAELEARPMHKKPIPPLFFPEGDKNGAEPGSAGVTEKNQATGPVEGVNVETHAQPRKVEEKSPATPGREPDVAVEKEPGTEPAAAQPVTAEPLAVVGPQLLDLSFENSTERGEMILFHLNDFFSPTVSAVEKGSPRVVCDFNEMSLGSQVPALLRVDSTYVQSIETSQLRNPDRVRVILQLAPGTDYDLQQVFFRSDNIFVLIVNELTPDRSKSEN
jgi:hypothetical protein